MHRFTFACILTACALIATNLSAHDYADFEDEESLIYHKSSDWDFLGRADSTEIVTFTIALKQRNIEMLQKWVPDVSDPKSPNYGRYWTRDEINDFIAPSKQDIERVLAWLHEYGVDDYTLFGDAIRCKTTIKVAEKLFTTRSFYRFQNLVSRKVAIKAIEAYKTPQKLSDIIEFVDGISNYLYPAHKTRRKSQVRSNSSPADPGGVGREVFNRLYNITQNIGWHSQRCYLPFECQVRSRCLPYHPCR